MGLKAKELAVMARFEPPIDHTVKLLHRLVQYHGRMKTSFLLGVNPSMLSHWLSLRAVPTRRNAAAFRLLAMAPDSAIRQEIRDRVSIPGARYVDRTKRKKVQKPVPVEDYAI